MHWPSYVEKRFYKYINNRDDCPIELINALKNSPRTKPFLDKLADRLSEAERVVSNRRGYPLKMETIDSFIDDMSKYLLRGIMNEADKRQMSYLEEKRLEAEKQYYNDLDKTADGTPTGAFEELEVVEVEREEAQR
jgi:hypothetical protein